MSERQRIAIGYFTRALEPALSLHTLALASRLTSLAEAVQTVLVLLLNTSLLNVAVYRPFLL